MVALALLKLFLIPCFPNVIAYLPHPARIVTPQQTGDTVSNENPHTIGISMFPPNNDNNVNEVLPPPTNAVTFPTSITIFLNITSGNFGFATNTPFTIPTTQSETPSNGEKDDNSPPSATPSDDEVSVTPVTENIDLSNGENRNDFGVIGSGGGDTSGQQPAQVIQNKMIFEEKCEEYYNMGSRKTRKATVQVFIVGGTNTLPKEFPHMAALGYGEDNKKEWLCGGSLISENYVVTAAHCLSSKTLGNVQYVRLGATNLQTETLNSVDYNVIKRIPHPNYNKEEQYYDIALLQLDHPVKFSDNIAPICLYPSKNLAQKKLTATGWGKTESAGEVSPELQKVELEYFPNSECQLSYSIISKQELPRGIVDETQICAGSRKEEKDTCQGDSGGPLQFQDNGRMYLVGITSFGIGCGKPGSPGVYTRVSYFIPWIEKNVWGK